MNLEKLIIKNSKPILECMECSDNISQVELMVLTTIVFPTTLSFSSFNANKYTQLDTVVFTAVMIRFFLISAFSSRRQQAAEMSREYISCLKKTCKRFFSVDENELEDLFDNRWRKYDNVFMNYEGDSDLLSEILTNILLLEQEGNYIKLEDDDDGIGYIFDIFKSSAVKSEVVAYLNAYVEPWKKMTIDVAANPDSPIDISSIISDEQSHKNTNTSSIIAVLFMILFAAFLIIPLIHLVDAI